MKTSLKLHSSVDPSGKKAELEELERCIGRCQAGDLRAHMFLARKFRPLIRLLAERKAENSFDTKEISYLSNLGREGLYEAVLEFKIKSGTSQFHLFALDYIEEAMENKPKGFWRKLFRRKFPK